MPEEEKKEVVNTDNVDEAKSFLDKVDDLKKNYVKKEDYDKIQKNYNTLAERILNGDTEFEEKKNGETVDPYERVKELRKELFDAEKSQNMSNLEYWEKALELRTLLIDAGEGDIFLPNMGKSVEKGAVIEANDIARAEAVAEKFADLIKQAEGDNEYFNKLVKDAIQ